MSLVLDCSAAMAWFMPDEHTAATQQVLDQVGENGAVPLLWRLEIGNALTVAVRWKRVSKTQRAEAQAKLSGLPIENDLQTFDHAWAGTLELADRFNLSLYDACYLELAYRRELPLVSLDLQLRKSARALNIPLLGI